MSGLRWLEERTDKGVRQREFTLGRGERTVPGVLWTPGHGSAGKPLVLFGHGASGDRHQTPIHYVARKLVAESGFSALAIDGPVHGRRKVGDGARGAFAVEWQRDGCVDDMLGDWRAALDAVQLLDDVGRGPVGYWGLSMGTIFGAPLVAAEPRIRVAVLGLMGVTGPTEAYRQRIRAAADAIACPVLFLMQLHDELFTREQYLELFDRMVSDDKRIHANPGLHPEVPVEELDYSAEFLTRYLAGEGKTRRKVGFSVSQ
jgi:pimeloyl-ACP methyl ester carboxylesterase